MVNDDIPRFDIEGDNVIRLQRGLYVGTAPFRRRTNRRLRDEHVRGEDTLPFMRAANVLRDAITETGGIQRNPDNHALVALNLEIGEILMESGLLARMGCLHECRVLPKIQVARIKQRGGDFRQGRVKGHAPDTAIMLPGCNIVEEEAGP